MITKLKVALLQVMTAPPPSNVTVPPLALKVVPELRVKVLAKVAVPVGAVKTALELNVKAPLTSNVL